eukprot:COSAG02_NODE_31861_length_526_cov_0.747073_2_plen_55_part_01
MRRAPSHGVHGRHGGRQPQGRALPAAQSRDCGFFKQKTAYEILRSDWSSDVCSSD